MSADEDLFAVPPARDKQVQERGGMQEEVADCYGPAHARRTDPNTSHRAAREVTPHTDNIRAEVERWAMARGKDGFIDEELSAAFDATDSSSYRTRRAELTVAKVIVHSGRHRMNSNARQCMVWVHRSFAGEYAPERQLSLLEQLRAHANRLDEQAEWCRKHQGRTGLAAELNETAALIRKALDAAADAKKATAPPG